VNDRQTNQGFQSLRSARTSRTRLCTLRSPPSGGARRRHHGIAESVKAGQETPIIDTLLSAEILQFIRSNFLVAPVPTVPEILLHKAGPKSGLWRLAEMDEDFGTPYWAYYWGGGLALARHVLNYPEIVAGRVVLDVGAGSGIVGIAAAKSGAQHVIAADIDRYAIAAIGLNSVANGVAISAYLGDLTAGSPPDVDVVLVGDLFYENDLAQRVTAFLDRCLGSNIEVLIGNPRRTFLPRTRLELLAEYTGTDFGSSERGEPKQNAVLSLRPNKRQAPI
jgi:predicted nicotinamide N-methyase